MSPLVKITGVGAHVPGTEGRRSRMVGHGAEVVVNDEAAERMVKSGVAELVGGGVAAEQAVTTDPAGSPVDPVTANDLAAMSVAQLKAIAKSEGLTVGQARTKPALLKLLAEAAPDTAPDAGEEVEVPEDLGELDDEALTALAEKLEVEVPAGTDRDALIDLLEDHIDDNEQTGGEG